LGSEIGQDSKGCGGRKLWVGTVGRQRPLTPPIWTPKHGLFLFLNSLTAHQGQHDISGVFDPQETEEIIFWLKHIINTKGVFLRMHLGPS
jgi:hypothetical protein